MMKALRHDNNILINDLLHRVSNGSETAFRELYDLYRDKIYTMGMYLTRSEHLAEEMVQEVFIKVWLKQEEIACQLNISVYTVKEHMKMALKAIRAYLEKRIDLAVFLAFVMPAGMDAISFLN